MNNKLIMHINYFEQGQSIDRACEKAVRLGFDGVEFRNRRPGAVEGVDEYLGAIYKAAGKHGLGTVMFGGGAPDLMSDDAGVRDETLGYCMDFYPKAHEMFGFEVCNLLIGALINISAEVRYSEFSRHGSFMAETHHWQQAVEGLKKLASIAEKRNFKFAMETHPNFLHDTVDSAMRLARDSGSDSMGVNLDYINANVLPGDISIDDAISKTGDRLYYVHLKNVVKIEGGGRLRTGLGDGEFNNRHILMKLFESGYEHPVCIEAPRQGDREWFATQDAAYIKSLMKEIG
ncbi:MAG: sugar phosphate isomerase/epimerase [Clostridia bacterium]|nr:sugar phosphate isomerase/epimerase [Clostridia bacterium]